MTNPHDGLLTAAGALAGSTPVCSLGREATAKTSIMLTTSTYGLQLEATFKQILHSAGIRQAESDFNAQSLLLDAQRINAQRLASCSKHFNPSKATAKQLLDWVYGIDHLIDVNGTDQIYAAIDLTANKSAVPQKMSKALGHRPMWSALGVTQFFVVHVDGDPADLTKAGVAAVIEQLWTEMEAAFNGPTGRVHVIRLSFS